MAYNWLIASIFFFGGGGGQKYYFGANGARPPSRLNTDNVTPKIICSVNG